LQDTEHPVAIGEVGSCHGALAHLFARALANDFEIGSERLFHGKRSFAAVYSGAA